MSDLNDMNKADIIEEMTVSFVHVVYSANGLMSDFMRSMYFTQALALKIIKILRCSWVFFYWFNTRMAALLLLAFSLHCFDSYQDKYNSPFAPFELLDDKNKSARIHRRYKSHRRK